MIWRRLRAFFGLNTEPRSFNSDERLQRSLQLLSEQERCSVEELTARLLDQALADQAALEAARRCWEQLTPREQDVVANICLGYTGRQIAARLSVSPETVKTHVGKVYLKCGLHSRKQLRQFFSGWDFSAWDT